MPQTKRIFINTSFLYGKMLITIGISLYSTRLILNALGATDFGVFNLVGGIIAMLSFLNSAMTVSTQRYLSFYLGASDDNKLKSIFSSSVLLHLVIGLIIILLLELGGIFLFNGALNIPVDRMNSAKIVFHFMVVSTFFTINAVPYDAAINAHEDFLYDALLGILESAIKLGIAFWLISTKVDKLIFYGLLIAGLTILIRVLKSIYCFRKYNECRVHIKQNINISLIKEMLAFAGWNLFGSFCSIARNQGLAVLLNLFFGVVINAAYAIATQVNAQLLLFSINMLKSLNPQIVKNEGSGDRSKMLYLTMLGCKLAFFLLALFAIPLILEMPIVLNIWLKNVPENTIIFCQLTLVISLIQLITYPLSLALQAVGEIKRYQTVVGSLLILNLPVAYLLVKIGLPPYSVFLSSIFLECIAAGSRIWFAHKVAGLQVSLFLKTILLNSTIAAIFSTIMAILPHLFMEIGLLRLTLTCIASTISMLFFVKYIVLTADENKKIMEIVNNIYYKVKRSLTFSSLS